MAAFTKENGRFLLVNPLPRTHLISLQDRFKSYQIFFTSLKKHHPIVCKQKVCDG
jgi:hypothetical protein